MHKNILIIKTGALGDVVRCAYFPKYIKKKYNNSGVKIWWLTKKSAAEVVLSNPYIDYVAHDFETICNEFFDIIYSLDDEDDVISGIKSLQFSEIVGIWDNGSGYDYCDKSAKWFNMGLRSKFGLVAANKLKKENKLSHIKIFEDIFDVVGVKPNCYIERQQVNIGLNLFAGKRWPSKSLNPSDIVRLIKLCNDQNQTNLCLNFNIFSGSENCEQIKELLKEIKSIECGFDIKKTEDSLGSLVKEIRKQDIFVTADTLALHLSLSFNVKTIPVIISTSEAEIENNDNICKFVTSGPYLCSYQKIIPDHGVDIKYLAECILNNV